jgi:cobalt/nickel transport protein
MRRRVKCTEFGVRSLEFWYMMIPMLIVASVLLVTFSLLPSAFCAEKWTGVDEEIVEKIAKEQGRVAREPLINTDQGDLLLFVFLLAGAVGGFVGGYYWRMLIGEKTAKNKPNEKGIIT